MRFLNRTCFAVAIFVVPLSLAWSQTKSSTPKAPARAAAPKPKPAPKAAAKKAPARRPAAVPIRQARPTKDRYVEIQRALADAGYFAGPVNGVWDNSSAEALRQFQTSQGLEPTGKIDALSLIRLDLGPKYDTPAENSSGAPTG